MGSDLPVGFVGYEPDLQTIIVAHQGTDPSKMLVLAPNPLLTGVADFHATVACPWRRTRTSCGHLSMRACSPGSALPSQLTQASRTRSHRQSPFPHVQNAKPDHIPSTATQILAAVENTAARFGATHVTLVGHSLGQHCLCASEICAECLFHPGAAIALLDSVYLPLHLPNMTFSTVGYGLPRVSFQKVNILPLF